MQAGLTRVLEELQPGRGYAEVLAAWSSQGGPLARGEVGWRPHANVGLFGYGQWTPSGSDAGVGARLTW